MAQHTKKKKITFQYHHKEGIFIFKKGYNQKKGLYNFALAKNPNIGHKKEIKFNDDIKILGYSIDKKNVQSGSTLHLTYYWQALRDIKEDYYITTHLEPFVVWNTLKSKYEFEWIHEPVSGFYPTSKWKKGDIIRDELIVKIPDKIRLGDYRLNINVYKRSQTGANNTLASFQILPRYKPFFG
jgi:hypothetical protein